MALQEQSVAEQLIDARERYVARGAGNPEARRGTRPRRHDRGPRRTRIPRLRRRHRLPEPRARAREGRRSGARAGRSLPAPDVDGRLLRGLRRGLPPAGRELAVRRHLEEHAHQQRRRGDRERRQDLARRDRPAGRAGLRPRVPRAHAARDDDDVEARLQEDVRAVRPRDLPRRGARTSTGASRATTRSARSSSRSRRRSTRSRWPAPCSSRCRARAASSRCRSTSRRASRSCSTATASSSWTTRSSPAAAAPGRCGRSSTTACSPTS